jgi:hypothetical protein
MIEGILIAAIGAFGAVVSALIQTLRKENKRDHGRVMGAVTRIEGKIDEHIMDHAKAQVRQDK